MKDFVLGETKKALGRLRMTILFIIRTIFIAAVNVIFWFLPLILMGYFVLQPVFRNVGKPSGYQTPAPHHGAAYGPQRNDENLVRPPSRPTDTLRAIESFLRELRFFKRS